MGGLATALRDGQTTVAEQFGGENANGTPTMPGDGKKSPARVGTQGPATTVTAETAKEATIDDLRTHVTRLVNLIGDDDVVIACMDVCDVRDPGRERNKAKLQSLIRHLKERIAELHLDATEA